MLNIGILGSGEAGRTLAAGLSARGHRVRVGTRDPAKLSDWSRDSGIGAVFSDEAVRDAELIVVSVRGTAMSDALLAAGVANFAGKIVVDASDPLDFSSGKPGLFVGTTDSLGERVQRLLPEARVVKAFNTVAAAVMVDPSLSGGEPDMFIAGNDDEAKTVVTRLLEDLGWSVVDFGGIENARWLEAISLAWVVYSHKTGNTRHAFKLIGK
jgi:predicted dinucleotide-binding enzyme